MYLKKRTFVARISLESMLFSHIFVNIAHSAKMADFEGYLEAGGKISEFYKVNPKLLGGGGGGHCFPRLNVISLQRVSATQKAGLGGGGGT